MTWGDDTTPENVSGGEKEPDYAPVAEHGDRLGSGASAPRAADVAGDLDVRGAAVPDDSLQIGAADSVGAERTASQSAETASPFLDGSSEPADTTIETNVHEVEAHDDHGAPSELFEQSAWESVATSLANLVERLDESQRLLARQVDHVDHLHAENQRLRAGELRAAISPLVRDLLRLHDDVGRLAEASTDESKHDMDVVRVSLLDVLARAGIVSFEPEVDVQFDPKLHNATGVVTTCDATREHQIAEVIRTGFHWEDGQILRVADVAVFKYEAPSDELPHKN
jgi:molecular chaperone GrpE (heat shock protein)